MHVLLYRSCHRSPLKRNIQNAVLNFSFQWRIVATSKQHMQKKYYCVLLTPMSSVVALSSARRSYRCLPLMITCWTRSQGMVDTSNDFSVFWLAFSGITKQPDTECYWVLLPSLRLHDATWSICLDFMSLLSTWRGFKTLCIWCFRMYINAKNMTPNCCWDHQRKCH